MLQPILSSMSDRTRYSLGRIAIKRSKKDLRELQASLNKFLHQHLTCLEKIHFSSLHFLRLNGCQNLLFGKEQLT